MNAVQNRQKDVKAKHTWAYFAIKIIVLLVGLLLFIPEVNPAKNMLVSSQATSLFSAAIVWNTEDPFRILSVSALTVLLGYFVCFSGFCFIFGNDPLKKRGNVLLLCGSVLAVIGLLIAFFNHLAVHESLKTSFPFGLYVFALLFSALLILSFAQFRHLRNNKSSEQPAMAEKYRLFLMLLPVLFLLFLFRFLPVYSWRFAFFDYQPGEALTANRFTGFLWFSYLFENMAASRDFLRIILNTAMIGLLYLAASWLPMAFAILLSELRYPRFQKLVYTFSALPHFASWVLVFSVSFSFLSSEGFFNNFLYEMCGTIAQTNYLSLPGGIWFKMLILNIWKNIGWGSIIYFAYIQNIDPQQYDAACIEGAGRWKCMRYITLPALMPIYSILLMISFANILSPGFEQYLVFSTEQNIFSIEVLDLYTYNQGIIHGRLSFATAISICKSLFSVVLFVIANRISKYVRGESIV